jgi:hypothetical protein
MKVFIDYDPDNDCYVASSEDGEITARHDSQTFIKLAFIGVARSKGYASHAADYDFIMRSSKSGGGREVDINEFWGKVNKNRAAKVDDENKTS